MNITHQKSALLRGAGGLAAAIGAASIAFGAFATSAAAGGNPNFEGILSAAAPTGFMSSPLAYDVSGGPVTVDFDVAVTNLTAVTQLVGLNFSADHILTYNGVDVADGQPGQPGITFTGPSGTTQVAMPGTQSLTTTWCGDQVVNLALQYNLDSCGYYQLDIWAPVSGGSDSSGQRDRATLASGFIRVLGCGGGSGSPTPSPTTTPSPTGSVQPTSTASPSPSGSPTSSPDGGVLAASTPGTGAGGGGDGFGLGLLLLGIGAVLVIAGRFRRAARAGLPPIDL